MFLVNIPGKFFFKLCLKPVIMSLLFAHFSPYRQARCFIHDNNDTGGITGKILQFAPGKLSKCRTILNIRKLRNLKYNNIELPNELLSSIGYHLAFQTAFVN